MRKTICAGLVAVMMMLCCVALAEAPTTMSQDIQIGPELAAMTLTFTKASEFTNENQEIIKIYNIELKEKDSGTVIQSFDCESQMELDPEYFATLVDLNFDGYLDMDVNYAILANNQAHNFYLWDAENNQFVETILANGELSWYTLYPESKMLYNYVHTSAVTGETSLFQWDGNVLTLRRKLVTDTVDGETYTVKLTEYDGGNERVLMEESLPHDSFVEGFDKREEALLNGLDVGETADTDLG